MKIIFLLIGIIFYIEADIIKDYSTGLTWQDNYDVKINKKNWKDAKSYCQELKLEGVSNWRLPSINELQSIVDVEKYNPSIKIKFNNIVSKEYWSSTLNVGNDNHPWYVEFKEGSTEGSSITSKFYVRCVRGR